MSNNNGDVLVTNGCCEKMRKESSCGEAEDGKLVGRDILCQLGFPLFAAVVVCLPLGAISVCFVTGVIFQHADVVQTDCRAENLIPSISGITGVTPQLYIWRMCLALQGTPRLVVGVMYYSWYMKLKHRIHTYQSLYIGLVRLTSLVYLIETSCLLGVSFVSNKENYPLHEKTFTVFMVAGIVDMVLSCGLWRWSHDGREWTELEQRSFFWKKFSTILIGVSTIGLLYYFYRHRTFCETGAFSRFSVCEYLIAASNIGFHFTAYYDFNDWRFVSFKPIVEASKQARDENGRMKQNGGRHIKAN